MRRYRCLLLSAAAAALAACQPPAGQSEAAAGQAEAAVQPAAAVALSGPAGVAFADAKALSVGMEDAGAINDAKASAFYRFDNKLTVRDRAIVRIENQSATLKPYFKIYNDQKSAIGEAYDGTPGASAETEIAIEPGKPIYVEVLPQNSVGAFKLSVMPRNAADTYEANEDVLSAKDVKVGDVIEANIMDDRDTDWYRFSGATKATVSVALENMSTTLKPDIKYYDANKSNKGEKYDGTPGANLTFDIPVEAGKDFYIQVLPYNSSGKYKLTVK